MFNILKNIDPQEQTGMAMLRSVDESSGYVQDRRLSALLDQAHSRSDQVTAEHLKRIGQYAILMTEQLGLGEDLQKQIYYAGLLHDIGKLAMPQGLLEKPGHYTCSEKETINAHTLIGEKMLRNYRVPYFEVTSEVALYHHERWDGSGYPYGLSGTDIPLSARIVAICDVYDALRSERPYKDSYSHQAALATMRNGDGRTMPEHFDPDILAAFLRIHARFDDVYSGSLNA
jgi:putative two-component system response regulator